MSQPQRGGFAWQRASTCGAATCLEVAPTDEGVAIRDSKLQNGPILQYTLPEWDAFVAGVKNGEFDNLSQP